MRKLLFEILILSVVAFGVLWLLSPSADAQECPNGRCPTERDPASNQGWRWAPGVPMAPTIEWEKANLAVVRIRVNEGAGPRSAGSGAIFRQERKIAYVLTAAHVVKDRRKNDSKAVVVYANGGAFYATVLACNETWDVAVLRISDPKVKPLALADNPPKPGDSVECYGFSNGVYRYARGPMTQFVAPGKDLPFEWMEVKVASRPGDSGGPIVNTKGRIVGLINGTDNRITAGPCLPRIRKIVDGLLGRLPPTRPHVKPQLPPEQFPPVTPVPAAIDYDLLAAAVLKQINPDDFRGPDGLAGATGSNGLPGPAGPKGTNGTAGPSGLQGPSGSYSDLGEEEMLDLANRIKKLISGSVRVKVDRIPLK